VRAFYDASEKPFKRRQRVAPHGTRVTGFFPRWSPPTRRSRAQFGCGRFRAPLQKPGFLKKPGFLGCSRSCVKLSGAAIPASLSSLARTICPVIENGGRSSGGDSASAITAATITPPVTMRFGGIADAILRQAGFQHADDQYGPGSCWDHEPGRHQTRSADHDRAMADSSIPTDAVGDPPIPAGHLKHAPQRTQPADQDERPRILVWTRVDAGNSAPPVRCCRWLAVAAEHGPGEDELAGDHKPPRCRKAAEIPSPGSGAAIPSIRGPMYLSASPVRMEAQPRAISSHPSVTDEDGIDQPTLTSPLAKPQTRPGAHAQRGGGHNGPLPIHHGTPSTTAPKASTEPTDKSMRQRSGTSVIPTAITVRSGLWWPRWPALEREEVVAQRAEQGAQEEQDQSRPR